MSSNLVPTHRTDRNGRTVIRHMRPESSTVPARQLLPVATLPAAPPSIRQVKRELFAFLDDNSKSGYHDTSKLRDIEQWIEVSTGKELTALTTAIQKVRESKESDDPALLREAKVIRAIIYTTFKNPEHMIHTHDMLSFRSAFAEGRFDLRESSMYLMIGVYLGNRCDLHGKPLPEKRLPSREGFSAALHYSFEIMNACLYHGHAREAVPVNEIFVTAETDGRSTYSIFPYRDQGLAYLISKNPDRVKDLIDLSLANKTSDPDRLLALMDYDGHPTLSSGAL